jgi:hypothetical protein
MYGRVLRQSSCELSKREEERAERIAAVSSVNGYASGLRLLSVRLESSSMSDAILREFHDPIHDQVAKCGVDRATNCPSDLLKSRVHIRSERGRNLCSHHLLRKESTPPLPFPTGTLVSRWGNRGAKARLNWARRAATDVHDRPYATARLCTLRSVSCRIHPGSGARRNSSQSWIGIPLRHAG